MRYLVSASNGAPVEVTFSEMGAGLLLTDGSMVAGRAAGTITQGQDPMCFTFTPMEGDLPDTGAGMFALSTSVACLAATWTRCGDTVAISLARPLLTQYQLTYALFAGQPMIACHDLFEDDE